MRPTRRSAGPGALACLVSAVSLLAAGCGGETASPPSQATATAIVAASQGSPNTTAPSPISPKARLKVRPPLTSGTVEGSVYAVVAANQLLIAGTDSSGVAVSADRGAHWRAMNTGLPAARTANALTYCAANRRILALVSGAVYAARPQLPLTWLRWGAPLPRGTNPQAVACRPAGGAVLIGDGSGALYSAATATAAWQEADTGLPVGLQAITTLRATRGVVYAGLTNGLARSTDGATWAVDSAFGLHPVTGLADLPQGGLAVSIDRDGLAVRRAARSDWAVSTPEELGLPATTRVLSVAYDPAKRALYLGTLSDGIRRLAGLAPPSRQVGGIQAGNPVNGMLPSGKLLFAATNGGIRRLVLK